MKVVVIGAGIAGLAASALLAREGHDVTVLEGRSVVGGRAGSWEAEGFRFDTGPSWYLMPEVFDHFYRLLGTTAEEQLSLITLDPGYRVYFQGHEQPLEISAEVDDNIALFESLEKGAGEQLSKYLISAEETYRLALNSFLYTTFADIRPVASREVISRAGKFAYLLTESLASLVDRTVYEPRLRQILGYPAVFLGASPYIAPSMYHLMSALDLQGGVQYPMGGFVRVIDSIADLARAEGVEILLNSPVQRIVVEDGVARAVEYVSKGNQVEFMDADIVVSAADLHHTETELLAAPHRTYPQKYWDARTPGPGALLLMLGVKGELPQLEHHTLLFAKDWKKGFNAIFRDHPTVPQPASLYICKPSGVDPDVAPDGYENVFVLVPIPADPALGSGDIGGDGDPGLEKLADKIIDQIADWAGIPDLADRIVLRRTVGPGNFASELHSWRGTALGPAHTLRQSAFFRPGNRSRKVKGLYYVGGSTIPGVGLPMCLISAELLIKRLRGDTSTWPVGEPLESNDPEWVAPEEFVEEEDIGPAPRLAPEPSWEPPAPTRTPSLPPLPVLEPEPESEPALEPAAEDEPASLDEAEEIDELEEELGELQAELAADEMPEPAAFEEETLEEEEVVEEEDDVEQEVVEEQVPDDELAEPAGRIAAPILERVPVAARFTDLAARVRFGAARFGTIAKETGVAAAGTAKSTASKVRRKVDEFVDEQRERAKPPVDPKPGGPVRLRDSERWPKPLPSPESRPTPEPKPAPDPEPEVEPELEAEPELDAEPDPELDAETDAEHHAEREPDPEQATEAKPEPESEPDQEHEPEAKREPEAKPEPQPEPDPEPEPENELSPDDPMAKARATLARLRAFSQRHSVEDDQQDGT